MFDDSASALRLWNFLLSEEDRLREHKAAGRVLVGAMKDLGTVPVMAWSVPDLAAFYLDGAWWIPCVMELSAPLMDVASSMGLDDSFCPVRAVLGACVTGEHFPLPDMVTCSVGATCDDLSAVAQRLEGIGHPVTWWEVPHRRRPERGEESVVLPGGFVAPQEQVDFVRGELERVRAALQTRSRCKLDDAALSSGIKAANRMRAVLEELRSLAYSAVPCPLPSLEMQVAEMLALHFCSDVEESIAVLTDLADEVKARVKAGVGPLSRDAVPVFWVNPVADMRVMNLIEDCGGRVAGTEYLFSHALDPIPEDVQPMEALARTALADPMVGSAADRAARILADVVKFGARAVIISRIPGASHCATEGLAIKEYVRASLDIPVMEIEVPPLSDAFGASLRTRIDAVLEAARQARAPR